MYIIRLDDASEYMDIDKWYKMERLLDKYSIEPLVGVIPNNQDNSMVDFYEKDIKFWRKVRKWQRKSWSIALHGYSHVYTTNNGGINPINQKSEFAGVSLETQIKKITLGIDIFKEHGIDTNIFFAPSHTFDLNTLKALKNSSDINIISDTIANNVYKKEGFYFIPQQSGEVRKLPFKLTTFCYHPNIMEEEDFWKLEKFLIKNNKKFINIKNIKLLDRPPSLYDEILKKIYFTFRKIKKL